MLQSGQLVNLSMGLILVEGIQLYAYHGCLEEEAKIGANYIVDVEMDASFNQAIKNDELDSTIDYVVVYSIVKKEMAIRSKLIEHVANRIAMSIKQKYADIQKLKVKVTKLNPPMNGNVNKVSVVVEV